MSVRVLNQLEVERLLDMEGCIEAMADALSALARGEVQMPQRSMFRPDEASLLGLMPVHRGGMRPMYALKTICVVPDNPKRGLDAHQGTVTLLDGETGQVRAVVNASAITAIRTAAVTAVATRALAREDARSLAILGAGVQAHTHLAALPLVREFEDVRIYSPTAEHARAAAGESPVARAVDSAEEAVRDADVVVTVTSASAPVLERRWLKPGAHVNAIGGRPPHLTELDVATVADSSFFVDRREAAEVEAGDYRAALEAGAIGPHHIRGELGEVLIGARPGRTSAEELTVFRSLGLAVEDLAAAEYVVRRAAEQGAGTEVDF